MKLGGWGGGGQLNTLSIDTQPPLAKEYIHLFIYVLFFFARRLESVGR
jgi:hypothetical protein